MPSRKKKKAAPKTTAKKTKARPAAPAAKAKPKTKPAVAAKPAPRAKPLPRPAAAPIKARPSTNGAHAAPAHSHSCVEHCRVCGDVCARGGMHEQHRCRVHVGMSV